MELKNNQLLITISDDKKTLTVESGYSYESVTVDICPKTPLTNIQNAVACYAAKTGLSEYCKEWQPKPCGYESPIVSGCMDCQ